MLGDEFAPVVVHRGTVGTARAASGKRQWALTRACSVDLEPTAAVTKVTFSPIAPFDIAAASGPRVSLVDHRGGRVRRQIARFQDVARSPCFKQDGRLLGAGCDNGTVQLFDMTSRAVLRSFKGHNGAVHSCKFTADGLRIMSGCDDGIVRALDIAVSKQLFALRGATDYVRAQAQSPESRDIWATGSYDRKARIYDLRSRKILFTLDHDAQIDDLILLPGGARAVTIGGPEVRFWDLFAGGKLVNSLRNHSKAATCGALTHGGEHLLTGGLDGQVKIYDVANLEMLSSISCEGQVLSLAVSPGDDGVAIGLASGVVDVRARKGIISSAIQASVDGSAPRLVPQSNGALKERPFEGWGRGFEKVTKKAGPRPGSLRYYLRGQHEGPSDPRDLVIEKKRKTKVQPYDTHLRRFRFGHALDAAVETMSPEVISAVVSELAARGALRAALAGRTVENLRPLLRVVAKRLRDPRYARVLCHVMEIILDLYATEIGRDMENDSLARDVRKVYTSVKQSVRLARAMSKLGGVVTAVSRTHSGS